MAYRAHKRDMYLVASAFLASNKRFCLFETAINWVKITVFIVCFSFRLENVYTSKYCSCILMSIPRCSKSAFVRVEK